MPLIEEQKAIVEEVENEMALVEQSKKRIIIFEQKIKSMRFGVLRRRYN